MLTERGVLDGSVVSEGADPDLVRPWEAARDLVVSLDDELDIEEADIREALDNYRELFNTLLAERPAP